MKGQDMIFYFSLCCKITPIRRPHKMNNCFDSSTMDQTQIKASNPDLLVNVRNVSISYLLD